MSGKVFPSLSVPFSALLLIWMVSLVSFPSSGVGENRTSTDSSRPNLIILIADQWRGQALGFLHEDPVETPELDSLANHGVVLKNFISNYPVCSPARAMLMSGEYPFTNHVYGNCRTYDGDLSYNIELSPKTICWSDVLRDNGYSLGYIGKWHLTAPHSPYILTYNNEGKEKWNEWTPPDQRHGFEFWYSYGTYDRHLYPMYWTTNAARDDFHYVNAWEPQNDVDTAIAFIENQNGAYRKAGAPFGLVVSMNPPHTMYRQVPETYYDLYKNIAIDSFLRDPDIPPAGTSMGNAYREDVKHYFAAITGDDQQIGRLLSVVRDRGLADNTIILFISDHGDCLGKHGQITKNNLYEESLRVPFILYWNGHIKCRIDSECLMSYPDIYPTLLDLMGFKSQIPTAVQGKSYASYLLTGRGKHPESQYFMGNVQAPDSASGFRGVRTEEYKLAYQRTSNNKIEKFLFDLKTDPFELHNLYGMIPRITDSLKNQLVKWLYYTNDPFLDKVK